MSDAPSLRSPLRPTLPAPFAGRIVDGSVIVFAIFTLLANVVVWFGGSADALLVVCAVALLSGGAAWVIAWRLRHRRGAPPPHAETAAPAAGSDGEPPGRLRALVVAGAGVATIALLLTDSLVVWWVAASITLLIAFASTARSPVRAFAPIRTRATDALLIGLGMLFAAAVAIAHRGDADDAFYVNLVVAALDHPEAVLFANDTLHGYADVPMALPVFELLSWELFQASLARLFGTDALTIVYRGVAPVVGLLVPLAWARLSMRLLPRGWPVVMTLLVVGLLAVGDGRASYGDFGVLRLHQGKSVLLQFALPLCAAYGIEFGLAPTGWHFARLAAVQVAALGLSASGLWLGPVVAGLGVASTLSLGADDLRRNARVLAAGVVASAYPLVLALAMRAATVAAMEGAVHPMQGAAFDGPQLIAHGTALVLGEGPYRAVALFALVAVAGVAPSASMRRFAAVAGLAFLLLFFGPFTAEFVANGITGTDTYFRVFWLIPLPLFVASLIATPMQTAAGSGSTVRWLGGAITLVSAGIVYALLPQTATLSHANGVRLGAPDAKVPSDEFALARAIAGHADADDFVLAPLPVARWIPLIQRHPRPLMVREMYLDRLHARLGAEELDRRRVLAHLVGGTVRPAEGPAWLAEAIDAYPLEVVCLAGPALRWPELRRVLLDSPLEVAERDADHEIWIRQRPSAQ